MTMMSIDQSLREVALDALSATPPAPTGDPALAKLKDLGTELWLDTGNLDEAQSLWKREFSALTTNNTLANQVVQTGVLDDIASGAVERITAAIPDITAKELVMELGFVVNCHIALRLVKAFGVQVSVELHPDAAEDADRTVYYAERYYAICPERFTIKIPLTPEGYCAVAQVRAKGIPVNYTLGFSARQNYLAAVLSNPSYCNVFLGRLNQVVTENQMGDGKFVGERAAMATQMALRELRSAGRTETKMIAASMRSGAQVTDLAGCDVYTIPPKAAREFLGLQPDPASLTSQVGRDFPVDLLPSVDRRNIDVLWDVDERFKRLAADLVSRGGVNLSGDDLRTADADHGTGLFHRFTAPESADILNHGKIPNLARWAIGEDVALDDLMTQSALQSFAKDQAELDDHLRKLAHLG